jgi:uncharacterized protein involved in exopolysaccharide biosynthesis
MNALPLRRELMPRENFFFVFRHKHLIGAVFFTAVLVATVGAFLTAPTYEAVTRILIKADDRAKIAVSPSGTSPAVVSRNIPYEEMLSQAQVITSTDFLIEVAKALEQSSSTSARKKEPKSAATVFLESVIKKIRAILQWPSTFLTRMYYTLHGIKDVRTPLQQKVEELQWRLQVTAGGSNILVITYKDENPTRAARVANTIATTYLSYYVKIYMPSDVEKFFDDQTQAIREELNATEAETVMFHQQHDIFDFPTQRNELLAKLADFEAQIKTAQTEIRAEQEKALALRSEASAHPQQIPSSARDEPDPVINQIKNSLLTLELQRNELLTRYTPTSSVVKELDNRVEQVKKTLAAEESKIKRQTLTGINAVYQTLETQLALSRGQLAALAARESHLLSHVENYRQQLKDLDARAFELGKLEREVDRKRKAYAKYVVKQEEARISAALDRSKILNLSIVETAKVPFEPVAPQKAVVIMLAGVLGLITGLGVAFLRERFDSTVKTPWEVELYAGLPVLAALPQRQLSGPAFLQAHVPSVVRQKDPSAT